MTDAAVIPGKDWVLWDNSLPGFGVRVKASGAKAFVIQYRTQHGRSRKLTLGKVDDRLPLPKARARASELLAQAKLGGDPATERKAARQSPTVASLADAWIEQAQLADKTRREYRRQLHSRILPALGRIKLSALQQTDIRQLISGIAKDAPTMSNRILATVSSMLSWGVEAGRIGENVALGIKRTKRAERVDTRTLTEEEVARLLRACRKFRERGRAQDAPADDRQMARTAIGFELTLLAGLRISDAFRLRWDQVDLDAGLIHFAEDQQKGGHTLPAYLPEHAVRLIHEVRNLGDDSQYLFPSSRLKSHPFGRYEGAWKRVREEADLPEDAHPKALRKSHGTLAKRMGVDLSLISKGLRHSDSRVTEKHYASEGEDRVAEAEARTQKKIAALGNEKAEVRPIR